MPPFGISYYKYENAAALSATGLATDLHLSGNCSLSGFMCPCQVPSLEATALLPSPVSLQLVHSAPGKPQLPRPLFQLPKVLQTPARRPEHHGSALDSHTLIQGQVWLPPGDLRAMLDASRVAGRCLRRPCPAAGSAHSMRAQHAAERTQRWRPIRLRCAKQGATSPIAQVLTRCRPYLHWHVQSPT